MPRKTFDLNDLDDSGNAPAPCNSPRLGSPRSAKAKATAAEREEWAGSQVGCKASDQAMDTALTSVPAGAGIIQYTVSDTAIAEMRTAYLPLTIAGPEDTEGFKRVHEGRMHVKNTRIDIDKKRKELKAEALAYGRRVDDEAKRITTMLEPIETHLQTQEDGYTAAKEAIRNAERLKAEAEAQAAREAEEARLKAEHDAEVERLRIARENLDAERRAMEAQQAEIQKGLDAERARQKAEQDKIDAANRAIEKEKKRLAEVEAARLRKIEDDRIAAAAAERARLETEARIARQVAEKAVTEKRAAEQAEADRIAAEQAKARADALKPDAEKLLAVADAVAAIEIPTVSAMAADVVRHIRQTLADAETKIKAIVASMGMV